MGGNSFKYRQTWECGCHSKGLTAQLRRKAVEILSRKEWTCSNSSWNVKLHIGVRSQPFVDLMLASFQGASECWEHSCFRNEGNVGNVGR